MAKNFVAGLLLLLQQPFDIGDAIEVSGQAGVVIGIDLRATRLRTFGGIEVLIPNTDVYVKVVRIFGRELYRRMELTLRVESTDIERVKQLTQSAVVAVNGVLADKPEPRLMVQSVDASTTKVAVWYWIDLNRTDELEAGDGVIRAVRQTLTDAGIPIKSVDVPPPHPDATGGVGGS